MTDRSRRAHAAGRAGRPVSRPQQCLARSGLPLRANLVGGYGVAQAALAVARWQGVEPTPAVVQGFDSIGGATARYLHRAGVRVLAVADRDGLIACEDGLDVEAMLAARTRAAWSTDPACGRATGRVRVTSGRTSRPTCWSPRRCRT